MIFYNTDKERYFTIEYEKEHTQVKAELEGVMQYLRESGSIRQKAVCCRGRVCRIYYTDQSGEDAITKQAQKIAEREEIYKDGMRIMG